MKTPGLEARFLSYQTNPTPAESYGDPAKAAILFFQPLAPLVLATASPSSSSSSKFQRDGLWCCTSTSSSSTPNSPPSSRTIDAPPLYPHKYRARHLETSDELPPNSFHRTKSNSKHHCWRFSSCSRTRLHGEAPTSKPRIALRFERIPPLRTRMAICVASL